MKKRVGIVCIAMICLSCLAYFYLHNDKKESESKEDVYLKTVVFKDKEDELIPISVNFHSQVELEEDVINRIDLMKSSDMVSYGLYPIFSEDLTVQSAEVKNNILTIDFNDELYTNQDAMDILEALTFTMTDYDDVNRLQLTINGKEIAYLPNSDIPVSSLTQSLGLNNFEETSALLHETHPVMVYNEKVINQYSYYVPTTIRVDENESIQKQVQTILNYISSKIHLVEASLEKNVLTIELDSNILLDNEKIDQKLEDLIVLSLSSIPNVDDVKILVNGEDARSKKTSEMQYNYIKI